MECSNVTNILTLPVCVGESKCACFDSLYKDLDKNYNTSSVLEYTILHLQEVAKYLVELSKHINKDRLLKEQKFSQVPALEVKQANDQFQETIFRLENYLSRVNGKGLFSFFYFNKLVNCKQIIDLFQKIAETQDMSLQYLNYPNTLLPINCLFEVLYLHQNCLYILQQFYHLVVYKKPIFLETTPKVNIKGFQFR